MTEPSTGEFPETSTDASTLFATLDDMRTGDLDWKSGRAFSLVYNPDDDEHEHLLEQVANRFQHENALNPLVYPSLMQMELDLVAIATTLFGTATDAGSISSGGTESIFLAVQVARDYARKERGIAEPSIITAQSAHPAFAKAAHYLDVAHHFVGLDETGRLNVDELSASIDPSTAMVVGSAPCYPYGVIDDIPAIAHIAKTNDVLCHVDACLGGWLLPFFEEIGEDVPPWDFRVDGVTSLSADIHKYGYTFKGLSTISYKSRDLLKHQHFWYENWPGGLYASGTTAGTRPAPPIAGAWAAIHHLGRQGYRHKATQVRDAHQLFVAAIEANDRLRINHKSNMPVFEFTATDGSIGAIADGMDQRGWHLDRQQGGLHIMLSPYHIHVADQFASDLREAVNQAPQGQVAHLDGTTYGGIV